MPDADSHSFGLEHDLPMTVCGTNLHHMATGHFSVERAMIAIHPMRPVVSLPPPAAGTVPPGT